MERSANAVITKARAIYGRMLSPAQYDELLRKRSVQEISAYLREKTSYSDVLAGVQDSAIHRGQLENLVHKDLLHKYVRIVKYVRGQDEIYRFVVMNIEIELILACLRNIVGGEYRRDELVAGQPTFVQPYVRFQVLELAKARTVEQLYKVVEHTEYGAVIAQCIESHPPEDGEIQYSAYGVALRKYYFHRLIEQTRDMKGTAAKQMRELITIRAELLNLNTIFRMKTYFKTSPERIRQLLLPFYCKLSRRKTDTLIDARDAEEFMRLLCKTAYGRYINEQETFIESQTEPIRYGVNRHALRFSTDPRVVYAAFMMLRSMQTEDVIRIIEGVRYELAPEQIGKLLYAM